MIANPMPHFGPYRGRSPWGVKRKVGLVLWNVAWFCLCRWTPKRFRGWRRCILNLFGARIGNRSLVHPRSVINQPWNVKIGLQTAIGNGAVLYALGPIEIGDRTIIAQEAYICTGTHDFRDPMLPLVTKKIRIGSDVFIGARAFLMPGVKVGDGAIISACSFVVRNVAPWTIVAGNPAEQIGVRRPPAGAE